MNSNHPQKQKPLKIPISSINQSQMVNLSRNLQGSRLETTARGGELDGSVGKLQDYKNSVGDLDVYRRGVNGLKTGVLGLCALGMLSGCLTGRQIIGGTMQYGARTNTNPN